MPLVSVVSDPVALTLTAIGEYPVTVERLWAAWTNPRQLERFWGPPQWPATFTRHEVVEGGRSEYRMCGPDGTTSHGYWRFVRVRAPHEFEVLDGFARPDGSEDTSLPATRMHLRLEATEKGARFVATSTFASVEALEKLLAMGMKEGLTTALGQLDEVLADLRDYARSLRAHLEVVDDTQLLVTREVRGTLAQVWRCHQEPALLQRWMLGPDGWTMPVCVVARSVGERYRYEWENAATGERFGFTGELLESEAPRRAVTTESMLGQEGTATRNELVLLPRPGDRTRLELRITCPSKAVRDALVSTGMVDGIERSYERLEELTQSL